MYLYIAEGKDKKIQQNKAVKPNLASNYSQHHYLDLKLAQGN